MSDYEQSCKEKCSSDESDGYHHHHQATSTTSIEQKTPNTPNMALVFQSLLKQKSGQQGPVLARRLRLLSAPDEAALELKAQSILRKSKKKALSAIRVLPDPVADMARERLLKKVATKGAVHLFNAVHKHQQAVDAAKSEKQRKRFNKGVEKSQTTLDKAPATTNNNNKIDFMDLLKKGPAKII